MPVTSWQGWTTPNYREDPWYSAVVSLFDHVDSTVCRANSLASAFAAETVVVSAGGSILTPYLPFDGVTWSPISHGVGNFTVPASGAHVRLQVGGELYNAFTVLNANSTYCRAYLRAVINGVNVTPSSTWGVELPHGQFSYERRTTFAHVQVVSLGPGVHSVALQGLGVAVRNGGTAVADSYWTPLQLQLTASIVYRKRPYHEVVMANSPLGYWRLGEVTGVTTATDHVGSWHGAYTNTCTRVPRPGLLQSDGADGCMYTSGIDGTADYVEAGRANSLQQTARQAYTVTGIFRPESVAGSVRGYIIGTGSGASATTGAGWNVSLINGALNYIRLDGAGSFQGGNITAVSLVAAHSNHWFAITFTGSIATAWFRGNPVGSLTTTFSLATTSNFAIGQRVGYIAATGFRGGLDEMTVCSGVVSDDRLRALYAASVVDGT